VQELSEIGSIHTFPGRKLQGLIRQKVCRCYDAKLAQSKCQINEINEKTEAADERRDLQIQPF
jgi:hypothetical protein